MHKLLLVSIFTTSLVFAQEDKPASPFNKLSIDGGIGLNNAIGPFTNGYSNDYFNFVHLEGGLRYMCNNKFGFKADLGFDNINPSKSSLEFKSRYLRGSVQGVFNLTPILHFNTFAPKLGLHAHAGAGFSSLSGEKFKIGKGGDEMINLIFGFTPHLKVNEKIALTADLSIIAHHKQHNNFDFKGLNSTIGNGSRGAIATASFGISYKLGAAEKHLDWLADEFKPMAQEDYSAIEERVKTLEQGLKDDDNDGVLNMYDIEPGTAEGSIVNTKGQRINPEMKGEERDTTPVVNVISDIKKDNEYKPENHVVKDNSGAKDMSGMDGLFFTVQIGAYNYYMNVESHKKLDQVYMITLPDGKIRFTTGVFATDKEGYPLLYKAKSLGFSDAFMTAYYKGERIPIWKAREILKEMGPSVIDPAALKVSPTSKKK